MEKRYEKKKREGENVMRWRGRRGKEKEENT